MKLLIVQGPGYYGVNIRVITEEQASKMMIDLDGEACYDFEGVEFWQNDDGAMVFICDLPKTPDVSTGFNTGWMVEGEALIDRLLKGDLSGG